MAPYSELFGIQSCAEHVDLVSWVDGCAECDRERQEVLDLAGPFDHHEAEAVLTDYRVKRDARRLRALSNE